MKNYIVADDYNSNEDSGTYNDFLDIRSPERYTDTKEKTPIHKNTQNNKSPYTNSEVTGLNAPLRFHLLLTLKEE